MNTTIAFTIGALKRRTGKLKNTNFKTITFLVKLKQFLTALGSSNSITCYTLPKNFAQLLKFLFL
jgi:hypothetical protein